MTIKILIALFVSLIAVIFAWLDGYQEGWDSCRHWLLGEEDNA